MFSIEIKRREGLFKIQQYNNNSENNNNKLITTALLLKKQNPSDLHLFYCHENGIRESFISSVLSLSSFLPLTCTAIHGSQV